MPIEALRSDGGDRQFAYRFRECLREIGSRWIIDDDGLAVSESLDRMADVAGHDRNQTRPDDLSHVVDGHLEFALDHFIYRCPLPTAKYFMAFSAALLPVRMQSEMPIPE